MLYVPRHLPNKLEYKVLSCISVHYQSRMTSNGIAITPSHPLTVQAGQYGESEVYPPTVQAGQGGGQCRQVNMGGGGGDFARRSGIRVFSLYSRPSQAMY